MNISDVNISPEGLGAIGLLVLLLFIMGVVLLLVDNEVIQKLQDWWFYH